MRDPAYIDTVVALLASVRGQVAAAASKKLSLAVTRKVVDVAVFRTKLCGDDPWRPFGFDNVFIGPAVGRADREATERTLHDEDRPTDDDDRCTSGSHFDLRATLVIVNTPQSRSP